MVTTDISQLGSECNTWITNLRNYREEFNQLNTNLLEVASRQNSQNTLQEIEHYQNQFQIQLFNIHDLKLAIKEHEKVASGDLRDNKLTGDAVWSKHESLHDSYQQLDQTLQELKDDFKQFVQSNR